MRAAAGESVGAGTYYLGRPWRTFSRVVFQGTALSGVVHGAGWATWNGDANVGNVFYGEYGNTGAGAAGNRVAWARRLNAPVAPAAVLGADYAVQPWYDAAYASSAATAIAIAIATDGDGDGVASLTATPTPNPGNGGSGWACVPLWGQCGGQGWSGATCCAAGTCTYLNDWHSQCLEV